MPHSFVSPVPSFLNAVEVTTPEDARNIVTALEHGILKAVAGRSAVQSGTVVISSKRYCDEYRDWKLVHRFKKDGYTRVYERLHSGSTTATMVKRSYIVKLQGQSIKVISYLLEGDQSKFSKPPQLPEESLGSSTIVPGSSTIEAPFSLRCKTCQRKKIKCSGLGSEPGSKQTCDQCKKSHLECHWDQNSRIVPRKPGRKLGFCARKHREHSRSSILSHATTASDAEIGMFTTGGENSGLSEQVSQNPSEEEPPTPM